jgi:hypothetical protein
MMTARASEYVATACLALAVLHTFSVKRFQHLSLKYPSRSILGNLFHHLGEIEIVFGLWAAIFLLIAAGIEGVGSSIQYFETRNFTEPAFVFVIMTVCSSRPILNVGARIIEAIARLIPLKKQVAFYLVALVVGPLLGSLITEPAAMTVTALVLLDRFYSKALSQKLMYATIGLLFVNVSIGGVLTPYAAPPVLMVAAKWNWDLGFMFSTFGWKGALACTVSTLIIAFRFRGELSKIRWESDDRNERRRVPVWIAFTHLLFLILIVATSHHIVVFVGLFLLFLGLVGVTEEHHDELKLREALLVGLFLGGLVVLGGEQRWWLEPALARLNSGSLYLGAMGLTAITDNAALTYLGSQVPNLSDISKYALVSGSIVGGGLTVIANAPNPAGYGILNGSFGGEGISPLRLFKHALLPTMIAALCFWFL